FFFSRRGRHTRFSRDWSSDVCSSDLGLIHTKTRLSPPMCCNLPSPAAGVRDSTRVMVPETEAPWGARGMVSRSRLAEEDACTVRSEERRVAKEGSPGTSHPHQECDRS